MFVDYWQYVYSLNLKKWKNIGLIVEIILQNIFSDVFHDNINFNL